MTTMLKILSYGDSCLHPCTDVDEIWRVDSCMANLILISAAYHACGQKTSKWLQSNLYTGACIACMLAVKILPRYHSMVLQQEQVCQVW